MTGPADAFFPRPAIRNQADALAEAVSMLESMRLGFTYSAGEYADRLALLRLHMSDKQRSRLHTRMILAEKQSNRGAA